MIYLVGGAPRVGKSIVAQRLARKVGAGWVSTDLLLGLLRVKKEAGVKREWDASPEAIRTNADWFFPYFEHVVWHVHQSTDHYVIEGVDFLPSQAMRLTRKYSLRALFLGCSTMTIERLDQFPGHSPGYGRLPTVVRHQIADDVPHWSNFIRDECERAGCAYLDMGYDFQMQVAQAQRVLLGKAHTP